MQLIARVRLLVVLTLIGFSALAQSDKAGTTSPADTHFQIPANDDGLPAQDPYGATIGSGNSGRTVARAGTRICSRIKRLSSFLAIRSRRVGAMISEGNF